jgi:hypothetical protein
MQIKVRDGHRTLWVEEFGCYLENGELAFSYYGLPELPLPGWYGFPDNSILRQERRSNNPEHDTGDELWASASALADGPPRHVEYPKYEKPAKIPISWNLVPDWLHLDLHPDTKVTACSSFMGDSLAGFSAARLDRELRPEVENLLDQLDASGFDGPGENSTRNSYFLSPMTGGHHISVHISADSGDKAEMTFVDTMGEPVVYGYYNTPRTLEKFLGRSQ